jgi:hypothetical protein
MPLDQRLIGSWVDENGINLIKQDPETSDGRWYLTGAAASYSMPDSQTLLYPRNPTRVYARIDCTANRTLVGHWRHDADPAIDGDVGEDIIFRPDGRYVDFWDGESIFYDGWYAERQDASGTWLGITEYRLHLQTDGDSYRLQAVWDFSQEGTLAFAVDEAGRTTVAFRPAGGKTWALTRLAGQCVPATTTIGAVRRDAIRKRRG